MTTTRKSSVRPDELQAIRSLSEHLKHTARPAIPESLFVNKYLPILTYNLSRENAVEVRLGSLWIDEVAKHHHNRVDVHADGNPSEILFWVPSVLGQAPSLKTTASRRSFSEEVATANLQRKVIPAMGDNYLRNAAAERLPDVDLSEDQQQWLMILKRYDMLPKGVSAPDGSPVASSEASPPIYGEVNDF